MHRQEPARESRAKTVVRLVALALALVSAWPSAVAHPRREYVWLGSAPAIAGDSASVSASDDAGLTSFIHYLALPVAETPVPSECAAPCPRGVAALAPFGSLSGSPSSERGPPAAS
jgi:hypothetical protein